MLRQVLVWGGTGRGGTNLKRVGKYRGEGRDRDGEGYRGGELGRLTSVEREIIRMWGLSIDPVFTLLPLLRFS